MSDLPQLCDVLIVGGGPAGLAAAVRLRALGIGSVHVLERESETGGIPRHCAHSPYGLREFRRPMFGPAFARRLTAAAEAAGASLHRQVTVTALHPGGRVSLSTPDGMAEIDARAVLLATGVRESPRAVRLIGGTKPGGVLNTGALQGLVHLDGLKPFSRPLILGTELVSFSALLTCRQAGMRPVAMVEPNDRMTAQAPLRAAPLVFGVPLWLNTDLVAIHGADRVEGVTLATGSTTREVEVDGVVLTGRFRPENALLRASHLAVDPGTLGPEVDQYGRCSDPAYFAAGNLLRAVETAGWCWAEGRAVAGAIAADLAGRLPPRAAAQAVSVEGAGLAWVLPQRIAPAGPPPALPRLQARAARDLGGDLLLGGRRHRLATRPERRMTFDLPAVEDTVIRLEGC
ncbi:FAD/NAD(P)-binding oxidoreductase [Tropicimonas sp. IMCC34043]|uniref:NAD(P)/FAD-dependent oxidoreductase n=1 Tax=Tropicimonas sp. IMCC34043 TaxID=2248760 RepID=UPI0018E50AB9|nr:FAD/NAD(P)-binding oxidoreductase [Tropicimonas sp. IMCC34043]